MLCTDGIPHRPGGDACGLQFGVDRYHPGLAPLPLSDPQSRPIGAQVQIAASKASVSEIRTPALHCSSISGLARGLGAAAMRAFTASASRYSGRLQPFPGVIVAKRALWGGSAGAPRPQNDGGHGRQCNISPDFVAS